MRRYLILALLFGFAMPPFSLAADAYADNLYTYSPQDLFNPTNALGVPDGLYAHFAESGTYFVVDMGEEGTGDVMLTFQLLDVGAMGVLEFYDEDFVTLKRTGDYLPSTGTTWTVVFGEESPYRYIRIENSNSHEWQVDAIASVGYEAPSDEPINEELPSDEEVVVTGPIAGSLIKSEDYSAVYLLGSDGKRHAFPNETVFSSWSYSFDDVETVASEELASYTLGRNVTMKPATYLVKLQTNPKVFAVAPDATLRWVTSESVAVSVYGSDWASEVIDLADVFWGNYTVGEDIDEVSDTEDWEVAEHAF